MPTLFIFTSESVHVLTSNLCWYWVMLERKTSEHRIGIQNLHYSWAF